MPTVLKEREQMKYQLLNTVATNFAICDYYKIPCFEVKWNYGGGYFDTMPKTEVVQKACQAVVKKRRSDGSFFDFAIIDEEGCTIRGKHCKDIPQYLEIYNNLSELPPIEIGGFLLKRFVRHDSNRVTVHREGEPPHPAGFVMV